MKNMVVKASSVRAAQKKILSRLGHDFSGSLQAGIDSAMIRVEESERRLATVLTHPDLPGVSVEVDW